MLRTERVGFRILFGYMLFQSVVQELFGISEKIPYVQRFVVTSRCYIIAPYILNTLNHNINYWSCIYIFTQMRSIGIPHQKVDALLVHCQPINHAIHGRHDQYLMFDTFVFGHNGDTDQQFGGQRIKGHRIDAAILVYTPIVRNNAARGNVQQTNLAGQCSGW